MHDNDNRDEKVTNDDLDLLLRSALASYTDPGDTHDLDQRILTRFFGAIPAQPRRRWLPWAIALPLAASLLLAILLIPRPAAHRQITVPRAAGHAVASPQSLATVDIFPLPQPGTIMPLHYETPAPVTASQPPAPALAGHPERNVFPTPRPAPPPAVASLPKLDVFPTPQPLTPAEKALAAYAAEASASERQSLIEAQKRADTPLTIAAIRIPPLSPPDKGANPPDPGTN